jgi:hypothetical protein
MRFTAIAAFALALAVGSGAQATVNLVQNGSFTLNTLPGSVAAGGWNGAEIDANFGYANTVTNWTSPNVPGFSNGYNIYEFGTSVANVTGADAISRWPSEQQRMNANFNALSPDGGAFMILDGDPGFAGPLQQVINGLTVGGQYALNFYWAGGELSNRTGFVSDQLHVTFGGDTQDTAKYFNTAAVNAPGSFSGWSLVTMTFTAHSTSQVLSFLSDGAPGGNLPPVALLDGVSLVGVPEPADWTLLLVGFFGLGAAIRRRRVARA